MSVGKWTATTGWRQQKEHKEFHYHSVQVYRWFGFGYNFMNIREENVKNNPKSSLKPRGLCVWGGSRSWFWAKLVPHSLPCWLTQSKPHPGPITKKRKTELLRMQKPHCCRAINQFTLSLNVKFIFFLEPATSLPLFPSTGTAAPERGPSPLAVPNLSTGNWGEQSWLGSECKQNCSNCKNSLWQSWALATRSSVLGQLIKLENVITKSPVHAPTKRINRNGEKWMACQASYQLSPKGGWAPQWWFL